MSKEEEKKLNLLHRIKFWFKLNFSKKYKPYQLQSISPLKKAKAMDIVLELCLKYYIGEKKNIDFYEVANALDKKLNLCVADVEFLLDIMTDSKYIKEVYKKPPEKEVLEKIYCTPKGIKVFIDGGFELEARRKLRERQLIIAGQYLSLIIGLYYLATFLKEFLGVTPELLMRLICKIGNLL